MITDQPIFQNSVALICPKDLFTREQLKKLACRSVFAGTRLVNFGTILNANDENQRPSRIAAYATLKVTMETYVQDV